MRQFGSPKTSQGGLVWGGVRTSRAQAKRGLRALAFATLRPYLGKTDTIARRDVLEEHCLEPGRGEH